MLHQLRRRSYDDIKAIDSCFHSNPRIIHVASNMSEDFGFETEFTDYFAISSRLFRRRRRGELDVFDSEGVKSLCYADLGVCVKESVGKLDARGQTSVADPEYWVFSTCSPSRNVLSIILKFETLER